MSARAEVHATHKPTSLNESALRLLRRSGLYVLVIFLSVISMAPFVWTLSSSLKDVVELYAFPPLWFPAVPQWGNYPEVLTRVPYLLWMQNSVYVTVLATVGAIISSSLVGYSFARFRYPGRELIFMLTLSTMMLPIEVTLIPTYLLFKALGWLDSFKPLWVPAWLGGGAFNIFLMRQFLMTIPRDLDEAAKMDGASSWKIFWTILLPLSKPVVATIAVLSFISNWNSFMHPLIFLNNPDKFTLALGLRQLDVGAGGGIEARPKEHLLMAASIMMVAPCIALFFIAQRYFVQGIVMSGIKA